MKPLIFDGESVRAILAGRKTQTRRVMRNQPPEGWEPEYYGLLQPLEGGEPMEPDPKRDRWGVCGFEGEWGDFCPHPPGSIVWVRETFSLTAVERETGPKVWYRADNDRPTWAERRWQSPIHMPRWAARLWLRIADVRVERVQEISEDDAKAEGMIFTPRERVVSGMLGPADGSAPMKPYTTQPCQWSWREGATAEQSLHTARFAFANRWNAINAKPRPVYRDRQIVGYQAFPWDESHPICKQTTHRGLPLHISPNPWVWAHTFERIDKPEGA